MKYIWKKRVVCGGIAILLAAGISGMLVHAREQRLQEHLAKEVFRFHVLANSDSEEDQALKMKVKEEILEYMKQEIPESDSVKTTKIWAKNHLEEIENVSKRVILEEGYDYPVNAQVRRCQFPEKSYGDITFPAGEYEALRIEIGEAKGQNWWCVLYPNLCFVDALHAVVPEEGKKDLERVLDDDTYDMVTGKTRFKIRWFFF